MPREFGEQSHEQSNLPSDIIQLPDGTFSALLPVELAREAGFIGENTRDERPKKGENGFIENGLMQVPLNVEKAEDAIAKVSGFWDQDQSLG